jgi:hypothetical protein
MGSGLESLRYSRSDPAVASARGQTVKILAIQDLTPGAFAPLTGMIGGGPFRLAAGQWTDDTSAAARWSMGREESRPACGVFERDR